MKAAYVQNKMNDNGQDTLETDTLIIGGGLAGLAAGYALEGKIPYIIAEKECFPGGLSATLKRNGYSFDFSGHLLHLRWPQTKALILKLLAGNFNTLARDARVYMLGRQLPFPFQANLKKLPEKVRSECIREFLKAADAAEGKTRGKKDSCSVPDTDFYSGWAERTFGKGICRHFMLPYNFKLLQYPLNLVTTEWCAPFVPVPDRNEVLQGAYGTGGRKFGYNTSFIYPLRGGIGALAEKFAENLKGLHTGMEVVSVNIKTHTALLKDSRRIKFRHLINTSPLNFFISIQENTPENIKKAASLLKSNTVYVLNLGVKKPVPKVHWGYFPEKKFPFYRAGIASNFSKYTTPRGRASFYLEFATAGDPIDFESAEQASFKVLKECGFIKNISQIETKMWLRLSPAYVIYDKDRAKALPQISAWLAEKGIQSIGRYGAWKYSFMEEAVKEGLEAAENILKQAV
jgi:protoporphyrinogen oxidase